MVIHCSVNWMLTGFHKLCCYVAITFHGCLFIKLPLCSSYYSNLTTISQPKGQLIKFLTIWLCNRFMKTTGCSLFQLLFHPPLKELLLWQMTQAEKGVYSHMLEDSLLAEVSFSSSETSANREARRQQAPFCWILFVVNKITISICRWVCEFPMLAWSHNSQRFSHENAKLCLTLLYTHYHWKEKCFIVISVSTRIIKILLCSVHCDLNLTPAPCLLQFSSLANKYYKRLL